jgi:uncharacterized protein (TIGR02246 family)
VHHSRTLFRAAVAAAALAAPLAAAPAHAQAALIPDTNMSPEIFRFRAEAMQDATDALNTWRTAWERDDVRELLRLYQKDALLVLPGAATPTQGVAAIEQVLKTNLPKVGRMELGVVDAVVDDHLMYIYQRFVMGPGANGAEGMAGTATLVMQREGSRWRIRAQIFSPEVVQSAAAAPVPAPSQATADGATP